MRKFTFIPVAAVAVLGSLFTMQSCSKVAEKLHYDLPLQSGSIEVVVPPAYNTDSTYDMGSGTNNINIDSFIKANTSNMLGVSNITSVKITSVKLTLLSGTTANNFANFQSCYSSFYSNSNTTPFVTTIPSNPDATSYSLDLPVDATAELKSYMTGSTYHYSVGGKLRRPVTDSVRCKIEFQFNITVNG
jgi:hypothetical protein